MTTYQIEINQKQKDCLAQAMVLFLDHYKHLRGDEKEEALTLALMLAASLEPSPMLNGLCL